MSGLIPNRKTREQLEAANREFVNRHRTYVEAWIRDRQSVSEDDLNDKGQSEREAALNVR